MRHFASSSFWALRRRLPKAVRELAHRNLDLLMVDPSHPSLGFKKIGRYRAIRVGLHYRALAVETPEGLQWFWIGSHSRYDRLVRRLK